jgi:hypothetical protein
MFMKKNLSACGLKCYECPAYLAHKNNDNDLRKKTAVEWTELFHHKFKPEDINCVGCHQRDGVHIGQCHVCALRQCAFDKQMPNCGACPEIDACQNIIAFEAQTGMKVKNNFNS